MALVVGTEAGDGGGGSIEGWQVTQEEKETEDTSKGISTFLI